MNTEKTRNILNRDFVLACFAQFALSFAYTILIPTLPIYLSRSGSTEIEIGVLIGILSISSMILRPLVGRALLRVSERTFMLGGSLLFSLSSIAYLWASPFWALLIVRIFQGIAMAFFYTAAIIFVANTSSTAHRGQSLSYFYLAFHISFAMAPSLGMLLINHFSFTPLFLVCTGLSLSSLFITFKLDPRPGHPLVNQSIQNHSFFVRETLPAFVMVFLASIVFGAVTAFFPLYALTHRMANPGLFFTIYAVTVSLGRILAGSRLDLHRRESVILPCLIAYIIAMSILSFSNTLPMFILVAVIWGIGHAFLYPVLTAYALDLAGSSRGPAMGIFTAVDDLGVGLGPVIMGIVLRLTGYPIMFLCLAFASLINLGYFYFYAKHGAPRA